MSAVADKPVAAFPKFDMKPVNDTVGNLNELKKAYLEEKMFSLVGNTLQLISVDQDKIKEDPAISDLAEGKSFLQRNLDSIEVEVNTLLKDTFSWFKDGQAQIEEKTAQEIQDCYLQLGVPMQTLKAYSVSLVNINQGYKRLQKKVKKIDQTDLDEINDSKNKTENLIEKLTVIRSLLVFSFNYKFFFGSLKEKVNAEKEAVKKENEDAVKKGSESKIQKPLVGLKLQIEKVESVEDSDTKEVLCPSLISLSDIDTAYNEKNASFRSGIGRSWNYWRHGVVADAYGTGDVLKEMGQSIFGLVKAYQLLKGDDFITDNPEEKEIIKQDIAEFELYLNGVYGDIRENITILEDLLETYRPKPFDEKLFNQKITNEERIEQGKSLHKDRQHIRMTTEDKKYLAVKEGYEHIVAAKNRLNSHLPIIRH